MQPATLNDLDAYMIAHCYNNSYAIGERKISEGFGLDKNGNTFIWYYTERGRKENLNSFSTEKEAVEFAFAHITADPYARRHLIGFLKKDESIKNELLLELKNRGIDFFIDEIPYAVNDPRCRVFVFGCDLKNVSDLKEKYGLKP